MPDTTALQLISGRLERGEIDSTRYLEELTRFVAGRIGCSRSGLRVLVDTASGKAMRCVAMYDAGADRMVGPADLLHPPSGLYMERLRRDGHVSVAAAVGDPVATGVLERYFQASGTVAMMDMAFTVNGTLYGAFSCEQTGGPPVEWAQRQLQALRKIASRASLTLMHVVTSSIDTTPGALWETSTPNRLATMPAPLSSDDGG